MNQCKNVESQYIILTLETS